MRPLRNFLQKYFSVSETEIGGFFVLISLVALLGIAPLLIEVFLPHTDQLRVEEEEKALQAWVAEISAYQQSKATAKHEENRPKSRKAPSRNVVLQLFDPNNASYEVLMNIGIPSFLSKRIIKYRSKGGAFYRKEDLQKIYDFPPELYTKLKPYIHIEKKKQAKHNVEHQEEKITTPPAEVAKKKNTPPPTIHINQADTAAFKAIYGIGSVLAARIVKFRDKLGGFHSVQQLKEVYGLKPEVCERLMARAACNGEVAKTLPINEGDVKRIASHPYVDWSLAKKIDKSRLEQGLFKSLDDLRNRGLAEETLLQKIGPYVAF